MGRVKRILSKASTVLLTLVVACAVVLLALHAFAGSGRALPGGYRPLVVLSGSMEPALPVGSVLLTRSVDPAAVRVGDIITFALTPDMTGQRQPFATHRVVEVITEEGNLSFLTKGDANRSPDANPVPAERLVGRSVLLVPYLGFLTGFVRSALGLVLMILLPGAAILLCEAIALVRRRGKALNSAATILVVLALCFVGTAQVGTASADLSRDISVPGTLSVDTRPGVQAPEE